jgi:hypothetical protein
MKKIICHLWLSAAGFAVVSLFCYLMQDVLHWTAWIGFSSIGLCAGTGVAALVLHAVHKLRPNAALLKSKAAAIEFVVVIIVLVLLIASSALFMQVSRHKGL